MVHSTMEWKHTAEPGDSYQQRLDKGKENNREIQH